MFVEPDELDLESELNTEDDLALEKETGLVSGSFAALELGSALVFGRDNDPNLGLGLVLGLIFEDCLELLLLAS